MAKDRSALFLELIEQALKSNDAHNSVITAWQLFESKRNEFTQKEGEMNRNANGRFLELIVQKLLVKNGIVPFYIGAEVALVPDVDFDIIIYTKECGPICLSIKTSLRERYKQANLEAIALKQVHRKSKTFLLTIEPNESKKLAQKIKDGIVVGIDDVIDCKTDALDELLLILKQFTPCEAGTIDIIKNGKLINK
jgi:hypothetical protein